jgi:predicted nucleic acid-binding protein
LGVAAERLASVVPAGARIVVDTNVVIAYLEGGRQITDAAKLIVDTWLYSGRNVGYVSVVAAMEVLVGPRRANAALQPYLDFLERYPNLTCVPVDMAVAREAARLRSGTPLKPPDALIVATAIAVGVDAIITNDTAWSKHSSVPVVTLRTYVT